MPHAWLRRLTAKTFLFLFLSTRSSDLQLTLFLFKMSPASVEAGSAPMPGLALLVQPPSPVNLAPERLQCRQALIR